MPRTSSAKRFLLGQALRSENVASETIPKRIALPVFASDALSSNAYATQEILVVLSIGGFALFTYTPWIAAAVVLVFFTVIMSYRQNVRAYPSGGGDYEVVSTNLGQQWGVFVASALLLDYSLTVAVSISAAVDNIASTFSPVAEHMVPAAVGLIILLTVMNLRGIRESGLVFATLTYGFVLGIVGMIGWAAIRMLAGDEIRAESADWTLVAPASLSGISLLPLLLRAFSSGTTALTGIEAISNGVPSFRAPASKNAATTLLLLGVISMSMFSAITWLALSTGVKVAEFDEDLVGLPEGERQKTVIAQVSQAVFSDFEPGYLYLGVVTALILMLAANTAFNGFPILGALLARDGYLPNQLHKRGDRLAFSNGIIFLAAGAVVMVIIYGADVTALIQLYVIGVFISFTLSQIGMIRHWNRLLGETHSRADRARFRRSRIVNLVGAFMTGSVFIVLLVSKFLHGAYIVVIAIPLLFLLMNAIHRHYQHVTEEITPATGEKVVLPSRVHAVVLVSRLHRPAMRALSFARASRPDTLEALTLSVDPEETQRLVKEWDDREIPVPLRVLDSPYREITRPVLSYLAEVRQEGPRDLIAVYVPEYVLGRWWERLLHNQSALWLKARLHFHPGVVVISVPWRLDSSQSDFAAELPDEPTSRPGKTPF